VLRRVHAIPDDFSAADDNIYFLREKLLRRADRCFHRRDLAGTKEKGAHHRNDARPRGEVFS
jgi:hypothetical protein